MLSKRPRVEEPDPTRRFRSNLADLFLSGTVTADRFQQIINDAGVAGAAHVDDLVGPVDKNTSRQVRRNLLKTSRHEWPGLYTAMIRTWSIQQQCLVLSRVSFLLPHELLHKVGQRAESAALYAQGNLSPPTREHLRETCEKLEITEAVALGFWADGMPFNNDRSESVEAVSWYLPGSAKTKQPSTKMFCLRRHRRAVRRHAVPHSSYQQEARRQERDIPRHLRSHFLVDDSCSQWDTPPNSARWC